jgi:Metal-dependent amidase/aminoacylase/carboxypeptidase
LKPTARLRQQLEQHQIRIVDLPLKTGLVAEVGPAQGPLIVLRSDIDALPIEEQSDVAFRSERPGVMHACGHDFHASAALGAAILLKQQEATLPGRVRILFQAAEETARARRMSSPPARCRRRWRFSAFITIRRCRLAWWAAKPAR